MNNNSKQPCGEYKSDKCEVSGRCFVVCSQMAGCRHILTGLLVGAGTSRLKVRLLRLWCLGLTMLFQGSCFADDFVLLSLFCVIQKHSKSQAQWNKTVQINDEARVFLGSVVKTKHQGLTSKAFMQLSPHANQVIHHICICSMDNRNKKVHINLL